MIEPTTSTCWRAENLQEEDLYLTKVTQQMKDVMIRIRLNNPIPNR
jgi:hypothetical protein